MSAGDFGPWREGIGAAERVARLRELAAIACLVVGPAHPFVAALRTAEGDETAAPAALRELDALPALKRRHILAACCNLGWRG